ncbi:MAG: hypothetical protein BWY66_01177 [bacterium ADurb.Bin374]|nr:MAG: hypothetical protein BWY66_01177 [bacterium ADurb.Bin374]
MFANSYAIGETSRTAFDATSVSLAITRSNTRSRLIDAGQFEVSTMKFVSFAGSRQVESVILTGYREYPGSQLPAVSFRGAVATDVISR